jgi:hypothetical protein
MKTALVFILLFPAFSWAKKPKAPVSPAKVLNKQIQEEINGNPDIRNCYGNSPAAAKKKSGQIVIDMDVSMRGQVQAWTYNKKLSTLPESTGNCLIGVLKTLIIPFESRARGQKISAVFKFPPTK